MSEEPSTDSVPCPSCGGAVSAAGATEWLTCPHCEYGWAGRLPARRPGAQYGEAGPPPDPSAATAERKSAYTMYAVCGVFWIAGAVLMVASREKVLAPPLFAVGFVVCWAATILSGVVANAGLRQQHQPELPAGEHGPPAGPDETAEPPKPTRPPRPWWGLARILLAVGVLAVLIVALLHTSRR